jgi:hypothetical protein
LPEGLVDCRLHEVPSNSFDRQNKHLRRYETLKTIRVVASCTHYRTAGISCDQLTVY